MKARGPSTVGLVAMAVAEAEDALEGLALTPAVRALLTRVAAYKTALVGLSRGVPRLTRAQRGKLVDDAVHLAVEAQETKRRMGSSRSEAG